MSSLNIAVARLRAALGDSAEHPHFIETLPKRGYRFIGEVSSIPAAAEEAPVWKPRLDSPDGAWVEFERTLQFRNSLLLSLELHYWLVGAPAASMNERLSKCGNLSNSSQ
jgi:hypothetical protein